MDTSDWPRGPLHRGIEVYAINLQGLESLTGPYSSREGAKANGVTVLWLKAGLSLRSCLSSPVRTRAKPAISSGRRGPLVKTAPKF